MNIEKKNNLSKLTSILTLFYVSIYLSPCSTRALLKAINLLALKKSFSGNFCVFFRYQKKNSTKRAEEKRFKWKRFKGLLISTGC
jgi:hypothetical protein